MVKVKEKNNNCGRCLIYPVKINAISREENVVIIEVDSLEELTMIAENFKKPLLHGQEPRPFGRGL